MKSVDKIWDTISIQWAIIVVLLAVSITSLGYGSRRAVRANNPTPIATVELKTDKELEWNLFIEALIEVESSGHNKAVGDGGKALGCLQIHSCMVDECNRILGWGRFTPDDRANRQKSIEMFNVVQHYYNPDRDLHLALKIWNPRAPLNYHIKVMEFLNSNNHTNKTRR